MIANGVRLRIVRHIVFFWMDVLVGEDGLAVGDGIKIGTQVELVIRGVMIEVVQRHRLVVGGVEHRVDGGSRRGVVGVTSKADEDHQIVVTSVVGLART